MQGPTQVINQFKDQLRWDIIDNQVHKVAVVSNGLTMQCACCHDHKFDPLSQRDYYSLVGILQNVQVLDGFAGNSKVFSKVKLTSLPKTPEVENQLNAEREAFDKRKLALEERLQSLDKELADAKAILAKLKKSEADTMVVFTGELGRSAYDQDLSKRAAAFESYGRGHNAVGLSAWLAGSGVTGHFIHGRTDEFGQKAIEGKTHVHEFHATILHLLGLDHEKLTYRHAGRDSRLTDVHGFVIREIIA